MAVPSPAPTSASTRVSRKNGSTTRKREAPSALRTAASRVRRVARAMSRLATFAMAISNTKTVATCIAPNTATSSGPVSFWTKVRNRMVNPAFVAG